MKSFALLSMLMGIVFLTGCNTLNPVPPANDEPAPAPVPTPTPTPEPQPSASELDGVWELRFEDGSNACMWIADGTVTSWQNECDAPDLLASPFTLLEFDGENFTARFAVLADGGGTRLYELTGLRNEDGFFFATLSIEKGPNDLNGLMEMIEP